MPLLACLLLPLWRHPFKGFQQRTRQKRLAQIGNATCLERRLSRGLVIGTSHVNDWKHGARCLQLTMQLKPRHAAEMNVKEDAVKFVRRADVKKSLRGPEDFRGKPSEPNRHPIAVNTVGSSSTTTTVFCLCIIAILPVTAASCASACFIDGGEQRRVLQRFREKGDGAGRFAAFAYSVIAMCSNDDGRNLDIPARQVLKKLETAHLRHLQVDDQTFGRPPAGERREKLLCRSERLCTQGACAQQPGQGLQHGGVIVDDGDPGVSFRHRTSMALPGATVELAVGPIAPRVCVIQL